MAKAMVPEMLTPQTISKTQRGMGSVPTFKAVATVKNRATGYWKSLSLPYPESGIRLIRQGLLESFDNQMNWFQQELVGAVEALDDRYY